MVVRLRRARPTAVMAVLLAILFGAAGVLASVAAGIRADGALHDLCLPPSSDSGPASGEAPDHPGGHSCLACVWTFLPAPAVAALPATHARLVVGDDSEPDAVHPRDARRVERARAPPRA